MYWSDINKKDIINKYTELFDSLENPNDNKLGIYFENDLDFEQTIEQLYTSYYLLENRNSLFLKTLKENNPKIYNKVIDIRAKLSEEIIDIIWKNGESRAILSGVLGIPLKRLIDMEYGELYIPVDEYVKSIKILSHYVKE